MNPTLVLFHKRGRIAVILSANEAASRSNPKTPVHCSLDHRYGVLRKHESNIDDVTRLPISAVDAPAMKAAFVSANLMYSFVYRCTSHRKALVSVSGSWPLFTVTLYPPLPGRCICVTFPRAFLRHQTSNLSDLARDISTPTPDMGSWSP